MDHTWLRIQMYNPHRSRFLLWLSDFAFNKIKQICIVDKAFYAFFGVNYTALTVLRTIDSPTVDHDFQ